VLIDEFLPDYDVVEHHDVLGPALVVEMAQVVDGDKRAVQRRRRGGGNRLIHGSFL